MIVIRTRRLAREWLWFAGTVLVVFAYAARTAYYTDSVTPLDAAWVVALLFYGVLSFVRLTIWAVKNRNAF